MDQAALIALGSNRPSPAGPPLKTVENALVALARAPGLTSLATSRLYGTPAFPPGAGADYVNAVAAFSCSLPAGERFEALLHSSLWGNRADLSNLTITQQAQSGLATRGERHLLLIDDTAPVHDLLAKGVTLEVMMARSSETSPAGVLVPWVLM